MKGRAFYLALLLALGLPMLAAGQEKKQSSGEPAEMQDVATMAQMRSLVPQLMELAWDDFFLNPRLLNSLGESTPSPDQVRKLTSLHGAFLAERERARGRLMEASLAFLQELGGDQVSARQIETRVEKLVELQGKLMSLRIRYLLRAINVLNHEQHQKLARFLDPTVNPMKRPQSPVPPAAPDVPRPPEKIQVAQHRVPE